MATGKDKQSMKGGGKSNLLKRWRGGAKSRSPEETPYEA
jgi:hypothetical protein